MTRGFFSLSSKTIHFVGFRVQKTSGVTSTEELISMFPKANLVFALGLSDHLLGNTHDAPATCVYTGRQLAAPGRI